MNKQNIFQIWAKLKSWVLYAVKFIVYIGKLIFWEGKRLITKYPKYAAIVAGIFILLIAAILSTPAIIKFLNAPRPLPLVEAPKNSGFQYAATDKHNGFSAFIGETKTNTPKVQASFPGGNEVNFVLTDTNKQIAPPAKSGNTVLFKDVRSNVDLEYQTLTDGIKENIIVKKAEPGNAFTFTLDTQGATPHKIAPETYGPVFYTTNGAYLFHFAKPFAIDAKGNRTDNVILSIHKRDDETSFRTSVIVNTKWLEDPSRVYPITIDPSLVYSTSSQFAAGQFNRTTDSVSDVMPTSAASSDGNTAGLWHMDEASGTTTVADSSTNPANGTSASSTDVVSGILGNARSFNGTTDNISLGNPAKLQITGNQTIEMWLYPTDMSSRRDPFEKAFGGEGTITQETNGTLSYYYGTGGGNTTPYQSFGSGTSIPVGKWSHIAIVRDLTNMQLYWYINGALVSQQAAMYATGSTSSLTAYIGKGAAGYYAGYIDDVKISNVARSATDIANDAQRTPMLTTNYQELPDDQYTVGLWHMNETSGGNLVDASGNGATGTATGTTIVQGFLGNARNFNGTSDYITVPAGAGSALDVDANPVTVEAWIKLTSITASPQVFVARYPGWQVYVDATTGTAHLGGTGGGNFAGKTPLSTGVWHHIAAVNNGVDSRLYVDGNLDGTGTVNVLSTTNNVTIGAQYNGSTYIDFTGGLIDEVRISNTARSAEEIRMDAQRRPYSVYTSDVIDLHSVTTGWTNLAWTELGVGKGGETPFDTTSLIAQWNFNNTSNTTTLTNDAGSCSTNCNGTLTNFGTGSSGQDALAGSGWTADNKRWGAGALMFDKVDDYVTTTYNAAQNPSGSSISVEAWVNSRNIAVLDRIIGTAASNTGYRLRIDATTANNLEFYIGNGSAYHSCSKPHGMISGNWYFVAATYNGSNFNLYVNGKNIGTCSDVFSPSWGTAPIVIGGAPEYWGGTIDSVRIYGRTLSATEILSNYNTGNVEFQTRVGTSTDPNDNTNWEEWRPATQGVNETQIDSMDSSYQYNTTDSGLQYYWPMDDASGTSVADVKGSNTGTAASANIGDGKFGKSRSFNGTSDYIYTTTSVSNPATFTLEAWFKTNAASGHKIIGFENAQTGTGSTSYDRQLWVGTDGKLYFGIYDTAGKVVSSLIPVTDNNWHHAVGVFTGSNINLYLDGVTQGNLNTGAAVNYSGYWRIGSYKNAAAGWTNGADGYFSGSIDEVRIYNTALSASTIQQHYSEGSRTDFLRPSTDTVIKLEGSASEKIQTGQLPVDANTVALWHLDEIGGTGAYIMDASPNANNGTPTGTTVVNGITGKARSFNGTSDYISVTANAGGPLDIVGVPVTTSAWIYPTSSTGTNEYVIDRTSSYGMYIDGSTSKFHCGGAGLGNWTSNATIPLNQWTFVACITNGSSSNMYINGQLDSTGSLTAQSSNGNLLGIGAGPTPSYYFPGKLDEISVSNVARSPTEIAEDYRLGRDHYVNRTISTDLSGAQKLAFNIAADRPGTYLSATIGNNASNSKPGYVNYQTDANTVGLWHLEENDQESSPSIIQMASTNVAAANAYTYVKTLAASAVVATGDTFEYDVFLGTNVTFIGNVDIAYVGGTYARSTGWTDQNGLTCWAGNLTTYAYGKWFHRKCTILAADNGKTMSFVDLVNENDTATATTAYFDNFNLYSSAGALKQAIYSSGAPGFNSIDIYSNAGNTGSSTNITTGPRIWYEKDSSANGNDGVPFGTTFTQGKIGKGRSFNGTSDFVNIPNSTVFDVTNYTIDAWVYSTNFAQNGFIFEKGVVNTQYSFFFETANGLVQRGYNSSGSLCMNVVTSLTAAGIQNNAWNYVASTYDGSNLKLYVNGMLIKNTAVSCTLKTGSAGERIGAYGGDSPLYYYNGILDEVRVSNVARSASDIRAAYEVGARTHQITIDFGGKLGADGITDNSDTSFAVDTFTQSGITTNGGNLYLGDKIIVKENYDGTTYIAQGTVNGDQITGGSGIVTVSGWDTGSTFPPGGFTGWADVFKWQREYFDLSGSLPSQRNAITELSLRETNGQEGRSIWLDDLENVSTYLTTPGGSTITSSTGDEYAQYRVIFSSSDYNVSPSVTSATLNFTTAAPNPPTMTGASSANVTATSIQWNFTDNSSNETGFKVYDTGNVLKATCATANINSCVETGLTPNTGYTRVVRAYNANGDSLSSSVAGAVTLAATPDAPTTVNTGSSTLTLTPSAGTNPSNTQLAIYQQTGTTCTGNPGTDGGFYLKADGTSNGSTAVWQTAATWGTLNITGLTLDTTQYIFCVKARNVYYLESSFAGNSTGGGYVPMAGDFTMVSNMILANKYQNGAYANGRWIAVGQGTNTIAYSSDGITWSGLGATIFSVTGNGVTANGTQMVAGGQGTNTLAYSSDGVTWTGLGTAIFNTSGSNFAWNGSIWVGTGKGTTNTLAYSSDGIIWTGLGKTIFSGWGQNVAWNGKKWVAVGQGTNGIAYSSDGIIWTGLGTSITNWGTGIAWVQGKRWALSGNSSNSLAYSNDGITWTALGGSIFNQGWGIASNGQKWVAAGGASNTIAYSNDGIIWTGLGTSIFSDGSVGAYAPGWGGTRWVIGGNGSTNTLGYSFDGITWTGLGHSTFSGPVQGVAWNGTRWVDGLDTGPTGWWKFDESSGTASDSSGNGYTLSNNAATYATGKYNNAGVFNGSADFWCTNANCGGIGKLDFGIPSASPFTFGAWFKRNGNPATYEQILTKKAGTGNSAGYNIIMAAGGTIGCKIADGTNNANPNSNTTFGDNAWHYAVCVNDGTNLTLYIDGATHAGWSAAVSGVTATLNNSAPFVVAANNDATAGFNGSIDEVRVYPKALTKSQIQQDMNTNLPQNVSTFTLSKGTLTILSGESVAAGSFVFPNGSTASIAIPADKTGELKAGSPIWTIDQDGDGYLNSASATKLYIGTSKPTNGRRRSLEISMSSIDCNDQSNQVFTTDPTVGGGNCNGDLDGDGIIGPNPVPNTSCLNTTSCSTATAASASTDGATPTTYIQGRLTSAMVAPADCNDNDANIWYPHTQCYADLDTDTYTNGLQTNSTCLNSTSCNTATYAGTASIAGTAYTTGQLKDSQNLFGGTFNDCNDNNASFPKARWVAVGNGGTNSIAYSNNGTTWTGLGKGIFTGNGVGVAWNGTRWVGTGYGGNIFAYSSDGITWTGLGFRIFTTSAGKLAWNGSYWIASGQGGAYSLAKSTDGINWTGVGTLFNQRGYDVAWNGSRWAAAGYSPNSPFYDLAYSNDGNTWTGIVGGTSALSIGYGVTAIGSRFIMSGYNTSGNTLLYSNDGITWSGLGMVCNPTGYNVKCSTTRCIVGCQTNITAAYSDNNGITWNSEGLILGNTYGNQPAWNGYGWVLTGQGANTLSYSSDGINWTGLGQTMFNTNGFSIASAPGPGFNPTVNGICQ